MNSSPPLASKVIATPVGKLTLAASETGLSAILWQNDNPRRVPLGELIESPTHPILLETERQLTEYFHHQRTVFSIPFELKGTPFQRSVWQALLAIPFGQTRTYAQLATQLGNPNATRAVGAANGRNPISILIPCHRVIGSSGKLTGFAGGLDAKAHLLNLESPSESLLPFSP